MSGTAAPILLLAIVAALFASVRAWLQPRVSLDHYAKALTTIPRRAPAADPTTDQGR